MKEKIGIDINKMRLLNGDFEGIMADEVRRRALNDDLACITRDDTGYNFIEEYKNWLHSEATKILETDDYFVYVGGMRIAAPVDEPELENLLFFANEISKLRALASPNHRVSFEVNLEARLFKLIYDNILLKSISGNMKQIDRMFSAMYSITDLVVAINVAVVSYVGLTNRLNQIIPDEEEGEKIQTSLKETTKIMYNNIIDKLSHTTNMFWGKAEDYIIRHAILSLILIGANPPLEEVHIIREIISDDEIQTQIEGDTENVLKTLEYYTLRLAKFDTEGYVMSIMSILNSEFETIEHRKYDTHVFINPFIFNCVSAMPEKDIIDAVESFVNASRSKWKNEFLRTTQDTVVRYLRKREKEYINENVV